MCLWKILIAGGGVEEELIVIMLGQKMTQSGDEKTADDFMGWESNNGVPLKSTYPCEHKQWEVPTQEQNK